MELGITKLNAAITSVRYALANSSERIVRVRSRVFARNIRKKEDMEMQPLLNELAKMLVPLVIANLNPEELDFFKGDDKPELDDETVQQALKDCLQEGWVDTEIEERIQSVITNGSWDFDISFSA